MQSRAAFGVMANSARAAFGAAALALLLAPSAPAESGSGVLRVAIENDPEGLDPLLHHHAPGKIVSQHIGESLVAYRRDLSIAPDLAERIDVSQDGRRYRFTLRPGLTFHNGAKVTAADVAWVWNHYYLDASRPWHCRSFYDGSGTTEERTSGVKVHRVLARGARVVEFQLEAPSSLFLHRLADTSCPPLLFHRDSLDREGRWRKLIGTGPFRQAAWERGSVVRLERFDRYEPRSDAQARDGYGGAKHALVDALEFVVLEDPAQALQALRDGRVDVLADVKFDTYLAGREVPGIRSIVTPLTSWYVLMIQTQDALLSDARVRRAIAHAIDLDYIAAVVTEGRQPGNPSVIPTGAQFHASAHEERVILDPARARALLQEAGYQGQSLQLQVSRDVYPRLYPAAVVVRSMLRAVGLNVELQEIPWKEHLDGRYRQGDFQLSLFLFGGRNSPTLSYGKFIGAKASLPRFQWDDEAALALVEKAEAARSETELQDIYDELHRRMIELTPTLALFNDERFDLISERVQGYEPTRFMRVPLWGVRLEPSDAAPADQSLTRTTP